MQNAMTRNDDIQTWPDLAIGLYDRLTGRGAEITYELENVRIGVPRTAEPDAPSATWRMDGIVRIRTRDRKEN